MSEDQKFAKSWKTYMSFNLFMLFFWIAGIIGGGIWKVSLIWGVVLFVKGVNRYGWPSEGNWPDWQKGGCSRQEREEADDYDYEKRDMYRRPKPRPRWRNKDLV